MNFDCDNFASGIQSAVSVNSAAKAAAQQQKNESATMMVFTHNKSVKSSLNCVDFLNL